MNYADGTSQDITRVYLPATSNNAVVDFDFENAGTLNYPPTGFATALAVGTADLSPGNPILGFTSTTPFSESVPVTVTVTAAPI